MNKEKINKLIHGYSDLEQRWLYDNALLLSKLYPKLSIEAIVDRLKMIMASNIKTTEVLLHDTYRNKVYRSDTLKMIDFIKNEKVLTGGNGVLLDRNAKNPAIKMLNKGAEKRNYYKQKMYSYDPKTEEYMFNMMNLYQGNEKTKLNAWYGINGAPTSLFFNLACATAITLKGQQLISAATCGFDMFLGNNVKFLDFDDCMMYVKNILNEKENRSLKDSDFLDRNIRVEEVYQLLYSYFEDKNHCKRNILYNILKHCSKQDLNRIYYKNNLEAFCKNKVIRNIMNDFLTTVDVYVDPSEKKTPPELKTKLDNFWLVLEEFILYNYQIPDKVFRVLNRQRKRVLVIDTDSNMIDMGAWVNFVIDNVVTDETLDKTNPSDFKYVIIYTMCYQLSKMIRTILDTYLKNCNVKKENRPIMDMKNEFLFPTMLITSAKKNYASIVKYKEGKDMHEVLDIKGLPINKSSTNRIASKRFKDIIEQKILKSDKINVVDILMELYDFENEIRQSLRDGDKTFLKPIKVNDAMAYADPLSNGGYRGAMLWNMLYPNNQIDLPDSFFLVKLTLTKENDLERIEDEYIRNTIKTNIFESEEKRIRSKGAYILAIPRTENIPEWAIPFIDEDTIVGDTMRAFMGVMKALGICTISQQSDSEQFSNYIAI